MTPVVSVPGTATRRGGTAAATGSAAVLALLTIATAAHGQEPVPPEAAPVPAPIIWPQREDLYDPGVAARHAAVNIATYARRSPSVRAPRVARLGTVTEDRTTEIVLVLARTNDHHGRTWVQVRLPVRPNGTTGWVRREALGEIRRVSTWLKIDRARLRLELVRAGKVVFRTRVGIGARRWPTPGGEFYVRNRLSGRKMGAAYGPVAFGTSARSSVLTDWPGGGVIGIHGTNQPGLLPGRVSHGCVRLRNDAIRRLDRLMPVGTPITIT